MNDILANSENDYQLFFDRAPIGITVTDFQGKLYTCNQAVADLIGYSLEELKSFNATDFYPDLNDRNALMKLIKETGRAHNFETKFKHKDGTAVNVLINTETIEYKDQKNILINSVRDISVLKVIQEDLRKERDFTTAILNTAASLIMVSDSDGKIVRFNRACEELTGYSLEEVKGKYVWDVLTANSSVAKKSIESLQHGSHSDSHESIWISKNGSHHTISWMDSEIRDKEGKFEYIINTGIDITARRTAEKDLFIANQKLADWVSELEDRSTELSCMSEMVSQLQSCQNISEACSISSLYIQKIFPNSQGAIYIINPSKDLAEAVEIWGDNPSIEERFLPLNCWALRRTRYHLIDREHPGLLCSHITGPKTGQYICIPMLVNGEAIGILHLNNIPSENNATPQASARVYDENHVQLIITIADNIALNISNLKLKETLRLQSIRDVLTGLYNRRYMEESLERELSRAEREKCPVGIIMFDIDHFKKFNDVSGHDAGDALLSELGAYLKKSTRGGDIVCRYGGEEFIAVLPGASLENTRIRAETMREGVKSLLVYHLGKPLGKCTISLGVACYPVNGLRRDDLIKNADNALYQAKHEGRDRVVVSSEKYDNL